MFIFDCCYSGASLDKNINAYDPEIENVNIFENVFYEGMYVITSGGNEETRRFLENLGFVAGTEITVVSSIGGNLIVNVKDSRIAVNEDMARHIVI